MSELITSYSELIRGIDAARVDMGVRQLDFEVLCSMTQGHWGKVAGPSQVKRLGIEKAFDALRATGLRMRLEVDPDQRAKMAARVAENFLPMHKHQARPSNYAQPSEKAVDSILNHLANKPGGLRRLTEAVKEARSAAARRGHRTRQEKRKSKVVDLAGYLESAAHLNLPASSETPRSTEANAA